MGYMITYDNSPIEELRLPIASMSWSTGERDTIEQGFEDNAVGFEITAPDGSVVATGRYHGAARDRDWPLESVRIHASRLDIDPVRLVYDDGVAYKIDPDFGFAVPEKGGQ